MKQLAMVLLLLSHFVYCLPVHADPLSRDDPEMTGEDVTTDQEINAPEAPETPARQVRARSAISPIEPGREVKVYFNNGLSTKGLLKEWKKDEIIIAGPQGECAVELDQVKDVKYYLTMDALEEQRQMDQARIVNMEKKISEHRGAQAAENVLGGLLVLAGLYLTFDSIQSRNKPDYYHVSSDEDYNGAMLQMFGGVAGILGGGVLFAVAGSNGRMAEKLIEEKERLEIELIPQSNSSYLGVKYQVEF